MTIGERIKEVRKSSDLTQTDFGKRVKISGASVSMIEKGINNPSDQTINLICREFHVNEDWLRTGAGEMSAKSYEDELEKMCAERGLSHVDYVAIRKIMEMPKAARDAVTAFMIDFAAEVAPKPDAVPKPAPVEPRNVHDWTPDEIRAEVDRQLDAEQRDREKGISEPSTGSPNVSGEGCA